MTTEPEMKIATVNSIEIAYVDQGQGPVVLLLHGFCGTSDYWEHIIPVLRTSCRVIAPDLRGHGQSQAGNVTNTMELLADDMAALLTSLQLDQVCVVGHSLGGYITLALVERHPNLVQKFALIHSTALPDSEEARVKRTQGIQSIHDQGIIPYVDELIPKLFAKSHLLTMPNQVQAMVQLGYVTSPAGAMQSLEGMRTRPDRNHVLRDHHVPILLVAGSEDLIVPAERMFTVSGAHIQTVIINGAGHLSMVEAPEQLLLILLSFIEDMKLSAIPFV